MNPLKTPFTFTKEPIAVIGLGSLFPDSADTEQFWNNIINKHSSIREVDKKRWDPDLYYSDDRSSPDKTYSKIGAFIDEYDFNPVEFRIPPKVVSQVDIVQQWALIAAKEALEDANYTSDSFPNENCAVIIGNSMGGDRKTEIDLRVLFPKIVESIKKSSEFKKLTEKEQKKFLNDLEEDYKSDITEINEDTMPGELANVIAGRIAATFNLRGKSMISDAACASSLAAIDEAYKGLLAHEFDACVVGGSDRSLLPTTYVKFSKIGALSADGSFPFDERANGFVQGEGAGMMVLKRLSDAQRDGDTIYCLIIGVGASSDGKGKGITAPNPIGQELALKRAYEVAGVSPESIQLIEAHGTSTKVGDRVEVNTVNKVFSEYNVPKGSVALGSIKSQIGHLKSAAGAAGMIKTVLALYHHILPPSINFKNPNPNIKWDESPCSVNTEPREWISNGQPRRAGVSSFGFGGTNYHVVLEEYDPSRDHSSSTIKEEIDPALDNFTILVSGNSVREVQDNINAIALDRLEGPQLMEAIERVHHVNSEPLRVGITYKEIDDLYNLLPQINAAIENPQKQKILIARGIFFSPPKSGKMAFVFPGQGSQYVDMLRDIRNKYQVVADTFDEADVILSQFLGKPISSMIFADGNENEIEHGLKQTQITQPAMLIADIALYRLLLAHNTKPDMVAGHSLGEYAALVASEVISFEDALMAVAIRGKAMSEVDSEDKGAMAAVSGKLEEIEKILQDVKGYCIAANKNSFDSTVISGSTQGIEEAIRLFEKKGMRTTKLSVSAAFHTKIVEPAGIPLAEYLDTITFSKPRIPITSNVTGEFFPENPEEIRELMKQQVGASVEWTNQVLDMSDAGATAFFEVGPKRALSSFISNIVPESLTVICNHPKKGGVKSLNEAIAAGFSLGSDIPPMKSNSQIFHKNYRRTIPGVQQLSKPDNLISQPTSDFSTFIEQTMNYLDGQVGQLTKLGINLDSVMITGVGLGLPGLNKEVFSEDNFERLFRGENLIDRLNEQNLKAQLEKNIRRLIKKSSGDAEFFSPTSFKDVINLAGQAGKFNLIEEFNVNSQLAAAYDSATELAIAAGLLALRDAGIPLVRSYKKTSTGSYLPGDWHLPLELQDDTGVIFASAFPGYNSLAHEISKFNRKKYDEESKRLINQLYAEINRKVSSEIERKYLLKILENELRLLDMEDEEYIFNRKILLESLSMGHSQFAQLIRARGPNTQTNAACASTTQAIGIANDWIRTGRCKRVIVISADNVTSDDLFEWLGSGFLASGAAAIKDKVEEAALPFDRRRDGMIVGMGAAALVIETESEASRRGVIPIVELLGAYYSNSSFHGTRLDVNHVSSELGKFLEQVKRVHNLEPSEIAKSLMFMSHETYTPRRGGSAAAEIRSLQENFGALANKINIANTKGFTGHAMGAGIEDVVAIKSIQEGRIPPIANFKVPDPDLGDLRLSQGGKNPVSYALRLAAGFGSQVAFTLFKKKSTGERMKGEYNGWLKSIGGSQSDLYLEGRSLRLRDQGANTLPTSAVVPPKKTQLRAISPSRSVTKPIKPVLQSSSLDQTDILDVLINEIAAATGYSKDMIEPTLELEADLGVDSVKTAEVFGSIREKYNLPQDDDVDLSQYPTIESMAAYFNDKMGGQVATTTQTPEFTVTMDILDVLIEEIAEATGYSRDMIEPSLELEADLGVDSVKTAEVFGTIREKYNLPQDDDVDLSQYPTIESMAAYFNSKLGTTPLNQSSQIVQPSSDSGQILNVLIDEIAEATGYTRDMIQPELELEADLGVDSVKTAEIFGAIREKYNLEQDEELDISQFQTINAIAAYFSSQMGETSQPSHTQPLQELRSDITHRPSSFNDVLNVLIDQIAEATGYTPDMIQPELELEADLGVDSVKTAEIFGNIRDKYHLPQDDELDLSQYATIDSMAEYFSKKLSEDPVSIQQSKQSQPITFSPQKHVREDISINHAAPQEEILRNIVAQYAGVPVSMIDDSVSLTNDLGMSEVDLADLHQRLQQQFGETFKGSTISDLLKSLENQLKAGINQKSGETDSREIVLSILSDASGLPQTMIQDFVILKDDLGLGKNKEEVIAKEIEKHLGKRVSVSVNKSVQEILNQLNGKISKPVSIPKTDPEKTGSIDPEIHRYIIRENRIDATEQTPTLKGYLISRKNEHVSSLSEKLGLILIPSLKPEVEIKNGTTLIFCNPTRKSTGTVSEIFGLIKPHLSAIQRLVLCVKGKDDLLDPYHGALSGMFKALAREFGITVKIVILDDYHALLLELGIAAEEVIYRNGERYEISLKEQRLTEVETRLPEDAVILASGGSQGITYRNLLEILSPGNTVIMIGRTKIREDAEKIAKMHPKEKEVAKKDLLEEMKKTHDRVTPLMLNREWAKYTKSASIWANLQQLETKGIDAVYFSVDVSDEDAIDKVFIEIGDKLNGNTITYFIHGAGVEISRPSEDKSVDEFRMVYDIKVRGWENIIKHLDLKSMRRIIAFCSVAGRFGNATQADYSAANEYLAKACWNLRKSGIDATAIDWSAWAEVGMATRGSTMKVLEAAGVSAIPLDEGLQSFVSEFFLSDEPEVVISGSLGRLASSATWFEPDFDQGIMIDELTKDQSVRTLSIEKDQYLDDHRIDGKAVLPGVMGLETMAEMVLAYSGSLVTTYHNVEFKSPVKLPRDNDVEIITQINDRRDFFQLELKSKFIGPDGTQLGDLRPHFSACLVTGTRIDGYTSLTPGFDQEVIGRDEIYKMYFHGPSYQVLDKLHTISRNSALVSYFEPTKSMFKEKVDLVTNPLYIESAFQAAGLHLLLTQGVMGLPASVDTILLYTQSPAKYIKVYYLQSDAGYSYYDVEIINDREEVITVLYNYCMIHTGSIDVPATKLESANEVNDARELGGSLECSVYTIATDQIKEISDQFVKSFLNKTELEVYSKLKSKKRKSEWLGGRIVAKVALGNYLIRDPNTIEIFTDENERPYTIDLGTAFPVSITHSHGVAMAVAGNQGIDLEWIEDRKEGFVEMMFNERELEMLGSDTPAINRGFSMKESHLKRLGIGWRVKVNEVKLDSISEENGIVTSGDTSSFVQSRIDNNWVVNHAKPAEE